MRYLFSSLYSYYKDYIEEILLDHEKINFNKILNYEAEVKKRGYKNIKKLALVMNKKRVWIKEG